MDSPQVQMSQPTPIEAQKYNFIPISYELISHVRRIDGFDETQLSELRSMLTGLARKIDPYFNFTAQEMEPNRPIRNFLETTLKLHQIFALVDVDYDEAFPVDPSDRDMNISSHLNEIAMALMNNGGFDYCPREVSTQGRVFEHAAESKILIDHLSQINSKDSRVLTSTFYVKIANEHVIDPKNEKEEELVEDLLLQERDALSAQNELGIEDISLFMNINKAYIDLTMRANGKADLYFHSYFIESYIDSLTDQLVKIGGEDTIDILNPAKHPFIKRILGLSQTLSKVIINIKKFPFNEKMYKKYVNEFGSRQTQKKMKYLEEIQRALFVAQIADDKEGLYWIEKLLIQLQGYCEISIRDQAIVLLNMLYDGVDWQLSEAFRPVIRSIGQHFIVNAHVNRQVLTKDAQIFLGLSAPSPIDGNNSHLLTWHQIQDRNIEPFDNIEAKINVNFGKFWKCGFYDWRLVSITPEGKLQPLEIIGKTQPVFPTQTGEEYYDEDEQTIGCIAQGRFVVHSRGVRDSSFHEVQIDYQDAQIDKTQNLFIRRGTFDSVERNIPSYASQGINCLYLMGTLERDNYPFVNNYNNEVQYRKDDASALAAVDRSRPNKMLGGDQGMKNIMRTANEEGVKIITDALARISSSRYSKKYKDLLLQYLDEDGRVHQCYGTDGQAQKFEDTSTLNYRKLDAWNLLIDEILEFSSKYGTDGIHLDNSQAWPQINEPDLEELQRIDVDGDACYTPEDLMNGEVVIRNENYGYWNSNNMETYPNPFFIKMCKKLWFNNPNFMIIGECWGGFMFENRQIILARSGVIPRLYKLPIAISSMFGKKLGVDGNITKCDKSNVFAIKNWYEETRKFLPEGTILMQSSSAHSLPYPAFLYGKGAWAAIDILFFMPDVPITFMGELDGDIYKVGAQQTHFQHEQATVQSSNPTEMKRSNSQIMKALHGVSDSESIASERTASTMNPETRRGLPKVRSGLNIQQTHVDIKEGKIERKETEFVKDFDASKGFDLSQIFSHYQNRRQLRKSKMVLRYGDVIHMSCRDMDNNFLPNVLCYARYSLTETLIITTNISDQIIKFNLDLSALIPIFEKANGGNTVIMVKNVISDVGDPEYYFLREFVELRQTKSLPAYRSLMISLTICQDDQFIFKKCLTTCIERTTKNLVAGKSIENEQISLLFSDCIENNPTDIQRFANVIGSIQNSFLDKLQVSFRDLFVNNSKLSGNLEMSSRLTAMCNHIIANSGGALIAPTRAAQAMHDSNRLGPIIFCTPEIGRWSTVGGLGVMVDELAIGLADLGQEIIVISPYYERNRKGQTGYLAQDPAGFRYVDNIRVDIDGGLTLGVHEGEVRGVKQVFLHNGDIFPSPYPDAQAPYVTKQVAVFGKACLEYCCQRQIIPALCITNDWFTGMVAAYAKIGHFGDTFKGTTFLHICHNLQETYEGRIYLSPADGGLEGLHKLPRDWLIDPAWKGNVLNPSRCAIMLSDQWATVSKSYREDLLNSSTLSPLLRQKPEPFAFPNGIPIGDRLKKLDACAPDHLSAKKKLQQKYFKFGELDDGIPLFAFVGRVTAQKGVHLILDVAENIIQKLNYKVQFIVGGPANMSEPYSAQCAHRMWELRNKYPHCFWAAPEEFFTDGSLVNRGTDFGLMPSVFEPGGIVQHEFFVGETPVIAFKTGGLKDSVHEYMWDREEGSGFTFEQHSAQDFIYAIERAVGTFRNKPKYMKLRSNAFKACMDGEIMSKAWLGEFYRLKGKIFINYKIVNELTPKFQPWKPQDYTPISIIQEIFGQDKKKQIFQEFDLGAADEEDEESRTHEIDNIMSHFDTVAFAKKPQQFSLHNRGPRHRQVQVCGSFDDWKIRHDTSFDPFTNQWFATLHLKTGEEFLYKYIINGEHWIVNDDEAKRKDAQGNMNNFCGMAL